MQRHQLKTMLISCKRIRAWNLRTENSLGPWDDGPLFLQWTNYLSFVAFVVLLYSFLFYPMIHGTMRALLIIQNHLWYWMCEIIRKKCSFTASWIKIWKKKILCIALMLLFDSNFTASVLLLFEIWRLWRFTNYNSE